MLTRWLVCFWLLAGMLAAAASASEVNPVRTHPRGTAAAAQQLIIKLRAEAAVTAPAQAQPAGALERLAALTSRTGVRLVAYRPITALIHAVRVEAAAGESPATTLERLRADTEVEYAVPDERRFIHAAPNDPLYPQQWYLQSAAATPSAVDALDAWAITMGSATLVIADIDTGVRPDHPDLAGRLLAGYCFISDPFVANGGACPGAGASDPGDWITSSDITNNPDECSNATAMPSSWHGTRVAGILGASTNNGVGVAGLTWSSPILPVRALGKCGGLDSDIISGMLWAGGIAVSGAPNNPNPAKIINMSLGGTGSCPSSYIEAIGQLADAGVLVVVSAGNEGGPVDAPANCPGVAGVAGLRQAGTKVGYSSLGPEVALGAPAGNCGDSFTTAESACVYTMTTTTNLSTTSPATPDANDYTGLYYCDPTTGSYTGCTIAASGQYRTYNIGTSFSAPVVSGIAALMSTVNSNLNSCQLISRLKEGALPFPQTSLDATGAQPPMCHVPTGATDIQNSECICTQDDQTCGAGMANAPGALTAALRPIAAIALPASVTPGQSVTLDASASGAANGHTVAGYQWSPVSGGLTLSITGAATSKASVTAPSCGVATLALTVTDDAGRADTANVVITPGSATTTAPAAAGQGSCSTVAPAIVVEVCPATDSIQTGGSATLAATLANTTNSAVTWEVNGVAGGNATVGTITSAGVYSAPASVPMPATVTITAVSAADATATGTAQLTIAAPPSGGGGGGGAFDWILLLAGGATLASIARRRRA
ncbi:MAG TPA: S8 family serine peptidase [Steroidobacteraceae bacterium]|nr:S8 family serine peptidase [Steroidobacteraceae bacterium]